jgi:hypothetical protein
MNSRGLGPPPYARAADRHLISNKKIFRTSTTNEHGCQAVQVKCSSQGATLCPHQLQCCRISSRQSATNAAAFSLLHQRSFIFVPEDCAPIFAIIIAIDSITSEIKYTVSSSPAIFRPGGGNKTEIRRGSRSVAGNSAVLRLGTTEKRASWWKWWCWWE